MNIKNWEVSGLNKEEALDIAGRHQLPAILAMLLQIRGFNTDEKINDVIGEGMELSSPFELKDMDKAVERIHAALDNYERIAVYGDYDADGVTSTSIVYTYLAANGADIIYYIPNREGEGYGMNDKAIDFLKEQGVSLIITVDNGISSVHEVEYASSLGIDVVITDHHRPHEELPKAVAVVDPYRADCNSRFKDFAGAGVALKLIMALESEYGDPDMLLEEYADLAALGTVADIVPLTGENRTIVKRGLDALSNSQRPGVVALLNASISGSREMTSTSLAFTIVPRINATGRMGSPERAVRLLICDDEEEATALSESISEDNSRRRSVESDITNKVIEIIESDDSLKFSRVIVVEGRDWHHGVVGIVAARITERYGKPCMIISYGDGDAKGSGRSVEGFNLFEAISSCSDLLVKYGGHPMAAGITLESSKIADFRKAINNYAKANYAIMPAPTVNVDCKLMPAALNADMPRILSVLEPFGCNNPQPVFGLFRMKLESVTPVGGGNHLRLMFSRDGVAVTCMKFSQTPAEFPYEPGDVLDLAVTLDAKVFRGVNTLTVLIKEIKPSSVEPKAAIASYRIYEKFRADEVLSAKEKAEISPTRDDFAMLYRYIREKGAFRAGVLSLLSRLDTEKFSLAKLLLSLDVLMERGLVTAEPAGDALNIKLCAVSGKVDVMASPILHKINR